jgi:hypothetical protein
MLRLPEILATMDDHEVHGKFIMGTFEAIEFYMLPNPDMAIEKAMQHFRVIQDYEGEGEYMYIDKNFNSIYTCSSTLCCNRRILP